jgi:hypothetical protein
MTGTVYALFTYKSVPVIFEPSCIILKGVLSEASHYLALKIKVYCFEHLHFMF